jgi:hypothetical protein
MELNTRWERQKAVAEGWRERRTGARAGVGDGPPRERPVSSFLLLRCRVPSRVAVATGVVVAAVTALTAAFTHLRNFIHTGGDALETVLRLCDPAAGRT